MSLFWTHNLKPYIFKLPEILPLIGGFQIRYYALAYVLGFLVFNYWMKYLIKTKQLNMSEEQFESLFMILMLGLIVGARIGYCMFYNFSYYIQHPLEILMTWHGGLSFHGGLIGCLIFGYFFTRKHNIPYFYLAGFVATIAPIGLFFGRLGNFINGELWGRTTDVPWAIIFPNGGSVARHPSQLYEALLEGIVLFAIMFVLHMKNINGAIKTGVFLIGYGLIRIFVEFFRQPDKQLGFIFFEWMTMGQILSIFMVIVGIILLFIKQKENEIELKLEK